LAVPIVPAGAGPYRKDQCRDAATAALTCGDRRVRRCSTSAGPPGTASARGAHGRPGTAHVLRTGDTPATTSRQRTPSRTPAFSSRSGQSVPASWRDSPSSPGAPSRRLDRSPSGVAVALRYDRWPRSSREIRRSVLEQSLRYGPLKARRMGRSVRPYCGGHVISGQPSAIASAWGGFAVNGRHCAQPA